MGRPAGGAAVDTSRLENKIISYCKKCLQYQLHNMIVCVFFCLKTFWLIIKIWEVLWALRGHQQQQNQVNILFVFMDYTL